VLAIIIALIGIANTLSLSIHERTRKLGLSSPPSKRSAASDSACSSDGSSSKPPATHQERASANSSRRLPPSRSSWSSERSLACWPACARPPGGLPRRPRRHRHRVNPAALPEQAVGHAVVGRHLGTARPRRGGVVLWFNMGSGPSSPSLPASTTRWRGYPPHDGWSVRPGGARLLPRIRVITERRPAVIAHNVDEVAFDGAAGVDAHGVGGNGGQRRGVLLLHSRKRR
jgi:hypothetical protein